MCAQRRTWGGRGGQNLQANRHGQRRSVDSVIGSEDLLMPSSARGRVRVDDPHATKSLWATPARSQQTGRFMLDLRMDIPCCSVVFPASCILLPPRAFVNQAPRTVNPLGVKSRWRFRGSALHGRRHNSWMLQTSFRFLAFFFGSCSTKVNTMRQSEFTLRRVLTFDRKSCKATLDPENLARGWTSPRPPRQTRSTWWHPSRKSSPSLPPRCRATRPPPQPP